MMAAGISSGALVFRLFAADAEVDVGRLRVQTAYIIKGVVGVAKVGFDVADILHDAAGDLLVVDLRGTPIPELEFPGVDGQVGGNQRLAGYVGGGIERQAGVENRVGNLVAHLVGMSFGDRFGGENVARGKLAHGGCP